MSRRILFVCGKARMRSATAYQLFCERPGVEADFAGLSRDADEPITRDHVDWADLICVMERRQKARLTALFKPALADTRIACLDIPDRYEFMQAELVDLLTAKMRPYLTHGGN